MRCSLCVAAVLGIASANTVSIPLIRQRVSEASAPRRHARRAALTYAITGIENAFEYVGVVGIGTPSQNFSLQLDTGSSDLWVNSNSADICQATAASQSPCGNTFDPSKSSTYEELSPDKYGGFNISYQDQTNVTGLMIMESVTIDGMTLHNQTMGLATNSTETRGILGLGLDAGESTVSGTDVPPYTYPTVIDNLVKQGIISKPVFSMYLNSLTNPHGNLLFGGVDTSKFYDELVTMPLIPFAGEVNITGYSVQLENFTALGLDTVQGGKLEALLDSGTSQTLIPQAWLDPITQHLGVEQDPRSDDGTTWVDCAMAQKHGNIKLVFQFVGKAIYVPMSTMVWRQTLSDADKNGIRDAIPDSKNWSDICTFGLAASDGPLGTGAGTGIFGDTFMRNAYVVHDLENLKVGLAQANTNSTGEDIVNVPDQGGIPAATGSPIPASLTQGNDNPLPTDPIPPQSTSGSGNESSGASHGTSAVASSRAIVASFVAAFIVHVFIL